MKTCYKRVLQAEKVDSCGICLLEFENDEKLKCLNCSDFDTSKIEFAYDENLGKEIIKRPLQNQTVHVFHPECIESWFYKKLECPLCRVSYVSVFKSLSE